MGTSNGTVGRRLRVGSAILLSTAAAVWFGWGVDWSEIGRTLLGVEPGWVAIAVGVLLFEFVVRAVRWRVLLRPMGGAVRVSDLYWATVAGAAANTLLPLRAGEVVRALIATSRTRHPFVAIVATNVMERVYDLLGLVAVLVAMAIALPDDAGPEGELVQNLKLYGGLFGAFAATCMGVFFWLATRERAAREVFARIVRPAPAAVQERFLALFDGFVAGLGAARDLRGQVEAGLLSLCLWSGGVVAIWCLFQAFGFDLPFGAACFVAAAIALTVALPQAPGYIGVFHVATEKTMVLWGLDPMPAKGFAIALWAVSFLPITMLGIAAFWREGLSLGAVARAARERRDREENAGALAG